ncbi:beta/gamma crystallin family protein [Hyphobacterium sp. CCMP332]|uniref:beta/gamma crystallin-related protein n=1 Tax=Hyphobacterium sp. CCMP332 TaxID=2749086 RepID=UPI0016503A90|nr:beta/gamma crystallin-related protein [Hyphobacterium sp. CCMP332]QNL20306.1 beta/gamma crystallin family protein [Hyphobacterium sp. CCMP332]
MTLYSGPDFSGQSVTINNDVTNFTTINFNDRALSIRIQGSGSWTVCQHSDFRGVCREITTDVPNLATIVWMDISVQPAWNTEPAVARVVDFRVAEAGQDARVATGP